MNKEKEKEILGYVFKTDKLTVQQSEVPDFICCAGDGVEFGVEITEFYTSGSRARLSNIPRYADCLISGSDFRHADDVKQLSVETFVVLHPKDKMGTRITGVIDNQWLTTNQVMDALKSVIEEKDKKYAKYQKKLSLIDLIVYDVCEVITKSSFECLLRKIVECDVVSTIIDSKFNEIYLVGNSRDGCFPLRKIAFGLSKLLNKKVS